MDRAYKLKMIVAFAAIYLVWGSTFSFVAISLRTFPPFLLSALRFLIGGFALSVYCFYRKEQMPTLHDLKKYSITGIVVFIGGVMSVVWAQQYISSSLASIVITTPFWFVVLDKPNWKLNFSSPYILGGLVLGLFGVILLITNKESYDVASINNTAFVAILTMITGSFFWVAGSLYLRYNPDKTSVYVRTSIQLLSAGLFCIVISFFRNEFTVFSKNTLHFSSVFALFYLAIVSTTLTFLAFIWLLKHKPATIVSSYSYVNPIVAVLLGSVLLHETIGFLQIVAMFIILSGVLCINIPNYKLKLKKI